MKQHIKIFKLEYVIVFFLCYINTINKILSNFTFVKIDTQFYVLYKTGLRLPRSYFHEHFPMIVPPQGLIS